jgi:hypothetical protein
MNASGPLACSDCLVFKLGENKIVMRHNWYNKLDKAWEFTWGFGHELTQFAKFGLQVP